ncbi:similar to ATP/GTP-binding protein [Aromatoleum aromaticum EbN1]|uniref:Similar to ATP/GTP-binding protein n=1 Tax=Aromatoleum aromaticum (strain DSM 19018 / LMG 30748 / EbN1) TaxID=76114 RepID=Q5P8Q0_AROAE|nr:superinfection exclusion B family protein [Aromatoleum aromaticum]CAI06309.1 similar to ATP/GTP-binding protein [Aromatoleum aromaticum EbN1]
MIAEAAKTFLEFLKLAPRYLIALGVMAAVLLFSSEVFLKFIGVFEFAQDNRPMLGLTLVVTGALFAVSVAGDGIALVKQRWLRRHRYRRVAERLQCLTEDEKQILRSYLAANTRANTLRIDDGVVQGLKANGIIHLSASVGNALEGFAHNISDFAWDYLHVHPHLLEGTTNTCRTDKRESYW